MNSKAIKNRMYRGQIIRELINAYPEPKTIRQLENSLVSSGVIIADISRLLAYLADKQYITIEGEDYAYNNLITLRALGVDLAEGTIEDDGVEV
ncbi:MAG: hypothetical protein BWY15_00440 [Firmicutes bacterium ADurb.Bin193]|nr:MAG: hypothetical protein BWY15_00440 [Firmicutes bacterium ADurb.Bin193]